MVRDLELLRVRRAAYTVLADVIAAKRLSGDVNRESVQAITRMSPSLTLNVESAGQRQTGQAHDEQNRESGDETHLALLRGLKRHPPPSVLRAR